MGTRKGKSQKLKDAELKLKAARQADQASMRNPDSPLKSARSADQSSANAMNMAVEKDKKEHEKNADKDLPDTNTTEALEGDVADLKADIKSEDDAKVEKKRLADERDAEIEERAEERFQKMMETRNRQTVSTIPAANDPGNHRDCCIKIAKSIKIINKYKTGITGCNEADVKIWLGMLDKINKSALSFSRALPDITAPTGRRNWSGFDLVCGDDDRESRIYKNEFIGACMILIEASADGQKWVDYTRSILKQLQKH